MSNLSTWLAAAGLACMALAAAPVVAQPNSGNTNAPIGTGGDIEVERPEPTAPERRYQVKAVSFEAIDETGWDRAGSDEISTIFYTEAYRLVVRTYGDIDSNDPEPMTYKRREECILPATDSDGRFNHRWTCDPAGVTGPLAFSVALYEEDPRSFGGGGFCVAIGVTDLVKPDENICADDSMHDFIGRSKVDVPFDLLNALAVGQKVERTIEVAFGCDQTKSGSCGGSDPIYHFTYSVTRVQDVP